MERFSTTPIDDSIVKRVIDPNGAYPCGKVIYDWLAPVIVEDRNGEFSTFVRLPWFNAYEGCRGSDRIREVMKELGIADFRIHRQIAALEVVGTVRNCASRYVLEFADEVEAVLFRLKFS